MAQEKFEKELNIKRTFNAPRDMVWKAWTDPKMVSKWWGPDGVTIPTCTWDVKTNGKIYIVMEAGKEMGPFAGQKWPMDGVFTQVNPQDRLEFTSRALDEKQGAALESLVTVDFEEAGEKTNMNIHIGVTKINRGAAGIDNMLGGMAQGWNAQTDKLVKFVEQIPA